MTRPEISDRRGPDRTVAVLLALLFGSSGLAQTSMPAVRIIEPAHLLILSSYSADTPYSQLQMAGFRDGLRSAQRVGHRLSTEFLDVDRRPPERIEQLLVELLREKYSAWPPKVVVTLDTPALDFADRNLEAFAPGASIVFCAATELPDGFAVRRAATGIVERIDVEGAIGLIGALLPDLKRLAIVSSPSGFAESMRELADAALARNPPPFKVEHIVEATRRDLDERVARLADDEAVLMLSHAQLSPDATPTTTDPLREFCEGAPVPVFGLFDTMLGHGVVGGRMTSGGRQGRKAGEFAARIVAGESARDIPIEEEASVASLFDARELRRWKIDRARLPEGSEVQFELPSVWVRNRREITAVAVTLTVLQAIVIWQLLRQRRRIRESEDRYRRLVELCPDAILVHDGARFSFANPAAVEMFGASDLPALCRHPVAQLIAPESREMLRQQFRTVLDEQQAASPADARMIRLDGRPITVEATGGPCIFEDRRHVQVMLRDVTERRRFDQQMQNLQKMETIGLLAGGVAHDFNNILTAMRISVDEARRALVNEAEMAAQLLTILGDAIERAAGLVRQLLAIGGRDAPAPAPVGLDSALRLSETLLDKILGAGVRTRFDLNSDGALVAIDAGRIEQIVVNFAANSADAMNGEGEFSVRTRRVELSAETAALFRGAPGRFVEIEVRDSGSGIASEHLPRIFEPFFTTKPSDRGTGLGLATIYGIARRAGGTVTVESQPGEGAVFRVLLPCTDPPAADIPRPDAVAGEAVLVVDDEPAIRRLAADLLRAAGYESHLAPDCSSALRIAETTPLAVAVLDVRLGAERGDVLALELRRLQPDLPIVFITGFASSDELERLRTLDRSSCLAKPFLPAQLLSSVNDAASPRLMAKPPAASPAVGA